MNRRTLWTSVRLFTFLVIAAAPALPQQARYGTGSWDAETLGNHRAVLEVAAEAEAVCAHIPLRRRDYEPEKKNIIIMGAAAP